ncbi:hypothetical protein D3C87_1147070 [compost metagenome]
MTAAGSGKVEMLAKLDGPLVRGQVTNSLEDFTQPLRRHVAFGLGRAHHRLDENLFQVFAHVSLQNATFQNA